MHSTIHVTTPCRNALATIDETILSVVTQAGDFRIRYHVQDGGSTDGTYERLLWWQHRLSQAGFPIQCREVVFTCDSGPDAGMYDAIVTGFARMTAQDEAFMTWINADDMFLPGAFALVAGAARQFRPSQLSWLGGAVAVFRDGMMSTTHDRELPSSAIRAGLADGTHWKFVQQEGVFFRKWLWSQVKPAETIRPMKLAGDWNLWRLMAHHSSLVQAQVPLAGFRLSGQQLSALYRDRYFEEIDTILPPDKRRAMLAEMSERGGVLRRRLSIPWSDGPMTIMEDSVDSTLDAAYRGVFGEDPAREKRLKPVRRQLHVGEAAPEATARTPGILPAGAQNMVAHDRDWQYPAITEAHAFRRLAELGGMPDGITYVAYPWATLIDNLQAGGTHADSHMKTFRAFCESLPRHGVRVTVCQHMLYRRFPELFATAGIDHVFWSHATRADLEPGAGGQGPRLHPFPLYPVQVADAAGQGPEARRPLLFSFIGARANRHYMTKVRDWILDLLGDVPDTVVSARDSWHYERIVYDHQIRPGGGDVDPQSLVDQAASQEFRETLGRSVFSLCPSGSGPNSIRLWESIGAGAIPVILSDDYAPPGNPALWQEAAVFCAETPEAVAALPERLAEIARSPARLARMRQAMRQLWMLYGPEGFVHDIQMLALAHSSTPDSGDHLAPAFLQRVARNVTEAPPGATGEAVLLLNICASHLLLRPEAALRQVGAATELGVALARARGTVGDTHPAWIHFQRVLSHLRSQPASPALNRGAVPMVHLFGRHGHRTPLSYAPLRRVAGERIGFAETPETADLLLSGFNLDLREGAQTLAALLDKRPALRLAVISEEPLWDTIWSGGFTERQRSLNAGGRDLPYTVLNHQTSSIFEFRRVPYFLLTSDMFATRYRGLLGRQAATEPDALLERWRAAPVGQAFFAERRSGETYSKTFPELDIRGLSAYRSQVAEAAQDNGQGVLRVGKGWAEGQVRQDLPDWHLDKLAQINGRTRIVSAYENTHQRSYVSEKIFDAFAVGGIPSYYASPQHRVFGLVPEAAMVNTFDLAPEEAAARLADFTPDRTFASVYLATQAALFRLFCDVDAIVAERRRVINEVLTEIDALV